MKKQLTASVSLLAVLLSAVLLSCGEGAKTPVTAENPGTEPAVPVSETEDSIPRSAVPIGTDLGNRNVRIYNAAQYENELYLSDASAETGDVVNDAVYRRNINVQENLNVTLTYIDRVFSTLDIESDIRKFVFAGDDAYDLILGPQWHLTPLATDGVFLDLIGLPYIDVENSWWAKDYIHNLNFGDRKRFFLTGDATLQYIRKFGCVYFNKTVYGNLFDDTDALYQTVLDGKWTFDKLESLSKGIYRDLNGNNTADEGDMYAYGLITGTIPDHLFYAAGAETCREQNGTWVLDGVNERTVEIADRVYRIFNEGEDHYMFPSTIDSLYQTLPGKFKQNETLFMFGLLYFSDYLRDMQDDYGVIPYPKYEESQQSYRTLVHDTAELICLPTTVCDPDELAAVIEEMAFNGYTYMVPEYYQTALKQKYMRDGSEAAMQIIDRIHDSAFSDVGFIYNYAIDGCGLLIRKVVSAKQNTFVSTYEKNRSGYEKKFTELLELYETAGSN